MNQLPSGQPTGDHHKLRVYRRAEAAVFRRATDPFGGLSNMTAQFPVSIGHVKASSAEALYQACRFPHRPDVQSIILAERSPMTSKMKSKRFREDSRPDWNSVRVSVMRWCLRVKLASNWHAFGNLLLSTGSQPIVEESVKDDFWGAKPNEDGELVGQNVLGRLLMELRQQLLDEPTSLLRVSPPKIHDFLIGGSTIGTVEAAASPAAAVAKPSA